MRSFCYRAAAVLALVLFGPITTQLVYGPMSVETYRLCFDVLALPILLLWTAGFLAENYRVVPIDRSTKVVQP